MNIVLCGLPRAGKTTFGRRLASSLHWSFVDTDELLSESGEIPELYQELGEKKFREKERQVLASLSEKKRHVIALGGGSLDLKENHQLVRHLGTVCYLRTPLTTVLKRMREGTIPTFLTEKSLEKSLMNLAEKRCPIYEEVADMVIDGE